MTELEKIVVNMHFLDETKKKENLIKINKDVNEIIETSIESPISNLAFKFGISSIDTPPSHKSKKIEEKQSDSEQNNNQIPDRDNEIASLEDNSQRAAQKISRKLNLAPENVNAEAAKPATNNDQILSFLSPKHLFRTAKKLYDEQRSSGKENHIDKISLTRTESEGSENTLNSHKMPTNPTPTAFKVYDSISYGSNDSNDIEDEYLELMEMENLDDDSQMPSDLRSLLCKDVKTHDNDEKSVEAVPSMPLPKFQRASSLFVTPDRLCLATINENVSTSTFKRPEPPTLSLIQSKRHKGEKDDLVTSIVVPLQPKRPVLRKTVSMNDAATIMDALTRSQSDTDLIGDFSKKFCLPYTNGRHDDLRSISSLTMRQLLSGGFNDCVSSYLIIDCRYPYEFEGGHIRGAVNLYTQELIIEELINKKRKLVESDEKRLILIFHCEFSSERGPKLSRFLRNHDRVLSQYPALNYPEIYLLHGGYKEFYQQNRNFCEPTGYREMLDADFSNEYKQFRAKSKSWTGDGRSTTRLSKSRSRLVL